ncbi:Tetraspanin-2 protein [Vigna angularis]|uniref:Tetraspanin-2 protein n=1 Tax=Phaseolus angularis TaxID=3914 RepID=A0A8T0LF28_PHAAN|nr:Tetraspanin-2 protein [Vigna angularis]
MGVSNNITAVLNFVAIICSIPIIASGIWLASKPDNECVANFRWPILIMGLLILLVSLAGFVGAYWNKQGLLALYLFSMALLIALLLILLVFAFVVTRPDGAYDVPGKAYKEYNLSGFSSWFRNRVTGSGSWHKIKPCLAASDVCTKLTLNYITADQFFASHISPLQYFFCSSIVVAGPTSHDTTLCLQQDFQMAEFGNYFLLSRDVDWIYELFLVFHLYGSDKITVTFLSYPYTVSHGLVAKLLDYHGGWEMISGCCKPPTVCGYSFVSPILWTNPVNPTADPDCYSWNNDQNQLCYDCNACKAGLLGNLRKEWRKANIVLIVAVVVLIWVYVIACSAFRNAQTEDLFTRYKQGWV